MNKITIRDEKRGIVASTERAREMAEKAENHPEVILADNVLRGIKDRLHRLEDLMKSMRYGPEAERRARKMQAVVVGIRAELRVRFADMMDEAQKRGKLSSGGRPKKPSAHPEGFQEPATASEAGLDNRHELHEARIIRNAERKERGISDRLIGEMLDEGREPSLSGLVKGLRALKKAGSKDPGVTRRVIGEMVDEGREASMSRLVAKLTARAEAGSEAKRALRMESRRREYFGFPLFMDSSPEQAEWECLMVLLDDIAEWNGDRVREAICGGRCLGDWETGTKTWNRSGRASRGSTRSERRSRGSRRSRFERTRICQARRRSITNHVLSIADETGKSPTDASAVSGSPLGCRVVTFMAWVGEDDAGPMASSRRSATVVRRADGLPSTS